MVDHRQALGPEPQLHADDHELAMADELEEDDAGPWEVPTTIMKTLSRSEIS